MIFARSLVSFYTKKIIIIKNLIKIMKKKFQEGGSGLVGKI
jgi:hypothetical protein